jgi:hypothetical protein
MSLSHICRYPCIHLRMYSQSLRASIAARAAITVLQNVSPWPFFASLPGPIRPPFLLIVHHP